LLVLREVYEAVGGHASTAVRGEILEDVALARVVKGAGYGIYFTAPMGTVRTRMYRSFGAMWQGWTKNLYPLMGGTGAATLRELIGVAPWVEALICALCFLLPTLRRRLDWKTVVALLVLVVVLRVVRYGADLYRNLYPIAYIQYWAAGVSLYSAALVASWWKNTRGAVTWKGRSYAPRAR
jgi:hypothetical protein